MQNTSVRSQDVPLRLREEFPATTYEQWKKTVEAELKGAPFDKKLLTKTYEGITLQPIYCQKDLTQVAHLNSFPGFAPYVRGDKAAGYLTKSWDVSQEIVGACPSEFNAVARAAISRGLTAINLVVDQATRKGVDPDKALTGGVGERGLSVATLDDLDKALDGIDLSKVALFVRSGAAAIPFAALLAALCKKRNINLAEVRGCIEMNPIGVMVLEGQLPHSLNSGYDKMAQFMTWASTHAPRLQTVCVHSRSWHEAGGSAVQELAFTLATAVEYLREMNRRGLDVNLAAPRIRFAMTVGSNFFMEIAKLRATRMLWAQVIAALGGSAEAQKLALHVRTAQWNKTVLDPYVNLLRTTVEAFAGAMGGCDSLQVGAFDEVIRTPDELSQRLACNTQIILQKECDLDKVMDPTGGAWYVEHLTDQVARLAWALFQDIEKRGGIVKALREGFPQAEVAKVAVEKLKSVAQRRDVIVGINQYANPKEKPLARNSADTTVFERQRHDQVKAYRTAGAGGHEHYTMLKKLEILLKADKNAFDACVEAAEAGATLGELTRCLRAKDKPDAPITPVILRRAAMEVEKLRAAVDAAAARGARPKVYLANMGPLAQHKARADFCRGFFAIAGMEIVYAAGGNVVEEVAKKAVESKAQFIVLCSTDETYPALVPEFVKAVKTLAPERLVILAGYPAEQIEAHKNAGVDEFVHVRVNAVEFLANLLNKIGVTL
ncbi:MAG: methylmalonyl-CoA mutase family protein [Verrucomicrobiota bacterium]